MQEEMTKGLFQLKILLPMKRMEQDVVDLGKEIDRLEKQAVSRFRTIKAYFHSPL